MTKMRVELKAEIDVTFSHPEKVEAVFIEGDWKECFWELYDLEEVVTHLANAFHNESDRWVFNKETGTGYFERSPEGFGSYISQGNGDYVMEHETTGKITISYEMELEPDGVFKII